MKKKDPHDKIFKDVWSDPEAARQFFAKHIPANLLNLIDLKTLQIRKDSFVHESLDEFFSDILYSASFGKTRGYLYLLLEHKSYFDKNTPVQILQYMDKIWKQHAKETKESFPLPIVLPMILYHGEDNWTLGTSFVSMFGKDVPAELNQYLPDFKYMLMDLSDLKDEQISGNYVWNAVLMFFKYVSTTKYADKIPEILKMIQDEFKKETGMKNLEALLIYLYSTQDREISEVIEVIKPILPEKEGILMTTAEMLRKEGREEGREEGIRKGRTDGIYQALVSTVNTRFQKVPEDITIELKTIQSQEKMMELLQQAVLCGDVGEYRQIVQQVIRG